MYGSPSALLSSLLSATGAASMASILSKLGFQELAMAVLAVVFLTSGAAAADPPASGLSLPQLHRFVRCHPSILTADVPSNLIPKLTLFHSLLSDVGASPDDQPQVAPTPPATACDLVLSLPDLCSEDRPFEDRHALANSHDLLSSLAPSNFQANSAAPHRHQIPFLPPSVLP